MKKNKQIYQLKNLIGSTKKIFQEVYIGCFVSKLSKYKWEI